MGTVRKFRWRVPQQGFQKIIEPLKRPRTIYVAKQATVENAAYRSVTKSEESLWRKAYEPYNDRRILSRFMAIKDQQSFVAFINRYGLLHGLVSDVYEDVLREASQMRRVYELWEQLDSQMEETLAAKISKTIGEVAIQAPHVGTLRFECHEIPAKSEGEHIVVMKPPDRDSISSIKAEICRLVTEALRRTTSVALRTERYDFVLDETSETLIGFLWRMLANQITQGTVTRLCPCCHRYFRISRPMRLDTVHCTPACSEKMKRWRRKLQSYDEADV